MTGTRDMDTDPTGDGGGRKDKVWPGPLRYVKAFFRTLHGWWRAYRDACDPPQVVHEPIHASLEFDGDGSEPGIVEIVTQHVSGRETMVYVDEADMSVALAKCATEPIKGFTVDRTTMVVSQDGQSLLEEIEDTQGYYVPRGLGTFDRYQVWADVRDYITGWSVEADRDTRYEITDTYGTDNTLLSALAIWAMHQARFETDTEQEAVNSIYDVTALLETWHLRRGVEGGFP